MLNTLLKTEHRRTFYETAVLKALGDLREGFLEMVLPDGERVHIGNASAKLQATIRVLRPDFFRKCFLYGDIGFGESFVDGDWETDDLTDLIAWMVLNIERHPSMSGSRRRLAPVNLLQKLNRLGHRLRANTVQGSQRNIAAHYDLSNDFFALFLDPTMTYSSAYFSDPRMTLEEAQVEKYDRLCRRLRLAPSDHVLEIGTGWGGFALHAAKHFGCRVTTITISKAQKQLAEERIRQAQLSDRIDVQLCDYRDLQGSYDKIVSIEMLEAVGHDHLPGYFQKCQALLKPEGLLGLQVITCPDQRYDALRKGVDWIQKHIFPGSLLPSIGMIQQSISETGDLVLHAMEDMGAHYVTTLAAWRKNFLSQREHVQMLGFDTAFLRKWEYYFSYCEAAFRMRNISVVQLVYTRPNNWRL